MQTETLQQRWWRILAVSGVDRPALTDDELEWLAGLEQRGCPPAVAAQALEDRRRVDEQVASWTAGPVAAGPVTVAGGVPAAGPAARPASSPPRGPGRDQDGGQDGDQGRSRDRDRQQDHDSYYGFLE